MVMQRRIAERRVSPPSVMNSAEETMLQEDMGRDVLGCLARGERGERIGRKVGVAQDTVKPVATAWRMAPAPGAAAEAPAAQ